MRIRNFLSIVALVMLPLLWPLFTLFLVFRLTCYEARLNSRFGVPSTPSSAQKLGRMKGVGVIDTDTIFILDGKQIYGFRDLPPSVEVIEMRISDAGRVERLGFKTKE